MPPVPLLELTTIALSATGEVTVVTVIVPLCTPCKSGMTGTATVSRSLRDQIEKHLTYVNVHTGKNPAGEIRGQLSLSH